MTRGRIFPHLVLAILVRVNLTHAVQEGKRDHGGKLVTATCTSHLLVAIFNMVPHQPVGTGLDRRRTSYLPLLLQLDKGRVGVLTRLVRPAAVVCWRDVDFWQREYDRLHHRQ